MLDPRIVSHEACEGTEDDLVAREKNHQLWLERERLAQIEFKAKLEKQKRDLARSQRKQVNSPLKSRQPCSLLFYLFCIRMKK